METYRFSFGEVPPLGYKTTLCLGTFDGVHLGHQALLLEGRKIAEGDLAVLCFEDNPSHYFGNGKSPLVLTSLEDKERLFEAAGVSLLYLLHLDEGFFAHTPEEFMDQVLTALAPAHLVVGEDYRFGKDAKGDPSTLAKKFPTTVVPLRSLDGEKVSTQRIISFLKEGSLSKANAALGRPYQLVGKVVPGFQNGRKMGFPTANLDLLAPYVLPKAGVYLGACYVHGVPYKALINIGDNPTLGLLKESIVECYLDGFHEDIYGARIYCEFIAYIRGEMKFRNLDELEKQMKKDRRYLCQATTKE
jgi:riboflavin kinase/FMN adenylyltransferase